MKTLTIQRGVSTDQGTPGEAESDDGALQLRTMELPWRDDAPDLSCVPAGTYTALWTDNPTKGWRYRLQGTYPRTGVLIHPANWGGDVTQGWFSQLEGCIALGYGAGMLQAPNGKMQMAVTRSDPAVAAFEAWAAQQPIRVVILDAPA